MAGERTHPILPCPELDDAIAFYEALGFVRTYRQLRPNPYAVVGFGDMTIHLASIDGFDPATSVSSVIVVVPDVEALYARFSAGLRERYGRLPVAGVPRILRIRRKQGTATGFSLVDVGGNWLRVYQSGAVEDEAAPASGLARAVEVAARQGDARGDEAQALDVLDRALTRHADASAADRVRALAYRVELLVRLGRIDDAAKALDAATGVLVSADDDRAVAEELAHASALVREARPSAAGA